MEVEVAATKDNLKISLSGELSANQATGFAERLLHLCDGKIRNSISIDFSKCNHIDSLGYGALVGFRLSPNILEKEVVFLATNKKIHAEMTLLQLHNLFKIQDAEDTGV